MAIKPTDIEEAPDKPISKMDPDAQYARLKKLYMDDYKGNSGWYKEAREDYAFESGDQWSEEDKEAGRLYVTFNRIKPTVDVICGMEVTNRQEVQYIPRTTGGTFPQVDPQTQQPVPPNPTDDDAEVNEGYTEVARWARDNCDAEDEESDAFRDTVICGMGWTESSVDYETDPEGRIVIDRIDPLEMGWDCTSTKRNLDDAKRFSRTRRDIDISDAQAAYPDVDIGDLHAAFVMETASDGSIDHDREKARNYSNRDTKEQRAKVTQVIVEWCEVETKYQVFNPADNSTFTVDAAKLKKMKKLAEQTGIPITSSPVKQRCWYRAVLGAKVLELNKAPCEFSSAFRPITGYRDRNKKQWYGIVRPMRDPQKWANKFFSVALEQIAKSGKGLLAETGSFLDDKKAEAEWAKNNITFTNVGAVSGRKITPKPQPPMLTGLSDLMAMSLQAIRDVTGVNQETVGLADRDQAASLEYQRRQAGTTILASFFDNLRRYRKEQGRVLLYMIRTYISDGRLVRILGESGTAKVIQLMKQPDTLRFDVIVDQAPSSPNQKEASWMVTQQILPMVMEQGAGPSVLQELLKMSPMPESGVQRLRRAYDRDQQNKAQQGPSLEEQKLQAETQKIQAEGQRAQTEIYGKQLDAQGKQADVALKQQQMQHEQTKAQSDIQLTQLTSQIEQMKASHEMQLAQLDHQVKLGELALKERELAIKEAELMLKSKELDVRQHEIAANVEISGIESETAKVNAKAKQAEAKKKAKAGSN